MEIHENVSLRSNRITMYCPVIDGSSTEFSTIYTVLKHAPVLSDTMGQEDTLIKFDLANFVKGKQLLQGVL